MQKLLFNLVIFTVAVIGWVVYSHWDKIAETGERVLSVGEDLAKMAKQSGVLPPDVIEAGSPSGSQAASETPDMETSSTVYKWRDASGRWSFGDSPPPGATEVQPMNVAANINVVSAIEVPEEEPENSAPSGPFMGIVRNGGSSGSSSGSNTTIPGIPNPANIQDMMNQIGNIQNSYNNRSQALD
ncbi:MAG: DUF4124 domain-containing protein [Gammaproteobacteria bacterium]